jgi:hypothetical protein
MGSSLEGLANAQVDINLDLSTPKLTFGVLGASPQQNWWKIFVPRFGEIAWTLGKESDEAGSLEKALGEKQVDVLLIESGRVGAHSPIWGASACKVVVSMEGWRGLPPGEWTIRRKKIRYDALGGVTNGEFVVHVAHRGEFSGFNWFDELRGAPAKLNHVLTCTGSGRKVPMTDGGKRGWTPDDRLVWGNRFEKIDTPTVYFKDSWLSRRLELKELKAVLDVPDSNECGTALQQRLKGMRMPGKLYVAVLDEVNRAFVARRGKRSRPLGSASLPTLKPPALASAATELSRKAAAEVRVDRQADETKGTGKADKAVKSDDAAVPVFLWNEAVCRGLKGIEPSDDGVTQALNVLRDWLLGIWKRKVVRDLARYLRKEKDELNPVEFEKCRLVGVKALHYSGQADWWK